MTDVIVLIILTFCGLSDLIYFSKATETNILCGICTIQNEFTDMLMLEDLVTEVNSLSPLKLMDGRALQFCSITASSSVICHSDIFGLLMLPLKEINLNVSAIVQWLQKQDKRHAFDELNFEIFRRDKGEIDDKEVIVLAVGQISSHLMVKSALSQISQSYYTIKEYYINEKKLKQLSDEFETLTGIRLQTLRVYFIRGTTHTWTSVINITPNAITTQLASLAPSLEPLNHIQFELTLKSGSPTNDDALIYVFTSHDPSAERALWQYATTAELLRELGVRRLKFCVFDVEQKDEAFIPALHDGTITRIPGLLLVDKQSFARELRRTETGPTNLVQDLLLASEGVNTFIWRLALLKVAERWKLMGDHYLAVSHPEEGPHGKFCYSSSHNETVDNPIRVLPAVEAFQGDLLSGRLEEMAPSYPNMFGIPLLLESNWSMRWESHQRSSIKVTLIVFTLDECGSCSRSVPVLQDLQKRLGKLNEQLKNATLEMYVINCSNNSTFCQGQRAIGYPSFAAFYSSGLRGVQHCANEETVKSLRSLRSNYHGPLLVDSILDWLSELLQPRLNILSPEVTHELKEDLSEAVAPVRLIAEVLPGGSSLIPHGPGAKRHFFCLLCLRVLCERLSGVATCFVQPASGSEHEWSDSLSDDMVVVGVSLHRADGVRARIMNVLTPLVETMENPQEGQSKLLHTFHKPHKYNLSPGQTCEHNHASCTGVLERFVRDHARLPVTPLSEHLFHQENSVLNSDLPLLVGLAHSENLTTNSSFMRVLQAAGRSLYSTAAVVSLNVDHNPGWAGQFVPFNYGSRFLMEDPRKIPPLYRYPRFCLIHAGNHHRAAFYPPVEAGTKTSYTVGELIAFVHSVLTRPARFIVATEHF